MLDLIPLFFRHLVSSSENTDEPEFVPTIHNDSLDPYSEEYYEKLVAAVGLDRKNYSHVDSQIKKQFKQYLRKSQLRSFYQTHH